MWLSWLSKSDQVICLQLPSASHLGDTCRCISLRFLCGLAVRVIRLSASRTALRVVRSASANAACAAAGVPLRLGQNPSVENRQRERQLPHPADQALSVVLGLLLVLCFQPLASPDVGRSACSSSVSPSWLPACVSAAVPLDVVASGQCLLNLLSGSQPAVSGCPIAGDGFPPLGMHQPGAPPGPDAASVARSVTAGHPRLSADKRRIAPGRWASTPAPREYVAQACTACRSVPAQRHLRASPTSAPDPPPSGSLPASRSIAFRRFAPNRLP